MFFFRWELVWGPRSVWVSNLDFFGQVAYRVVRYLGCGLFSLF